MHSFFFRELQLITVLLLICDSFEAQGLYLCNCVWDSVSSLDSVSFLLKFIFSFNKVLELLDFKES